MLGKTGAHRHTFARQLRICHTPWQEGLDAHPINHYPRLKQKDALMTTKQLISHANNFDLLRLTAAASVLLIHLHLHFLVPTGTVAPFGTMAEVVRNLYRFFPGVPVFFIISGFLITSSWLGRPDWRRYTRARFLRIYPAYAVAALVCAALLVASGFMPTLGWLLGQLSVFGYNTTPAALLPFGGEAPNGSLWTIPVEVSFYLLLPLLLSLRHAEKMVWLLLIISLGLNMNAFGNNAASSTLAAMFCYFGVGIIARLNWADIKGGFEGKAHWWTLAHVVNFLLIPHSHLVPAAAIPLVLSLTLAPMVISWAFSFRAASKVLCGVDLSYGLYLFHVPLIHTLRGAGAEGITGVILALGSSLLTALLSWYYVEKPALLRKT